MEPSSPRGPEKMDRGTTQVFSHSLAAAGNSLAPGRERILEAGSQRRWKIPTVGSRGDTDTSQEPEYGPSDPRDQILPGQTLCSQRPCEARQGLGPQGKASSSSRWPFLVLSQESQLQALGPAVQGSLPEGRPLLLSGIHYPFLFVWDSQNLTRCSQSTFP